MADAVKQAAENAQKATRKPARPRAPRVAIAVTSRHIETNITRDSSHCMIAEAIRSTVKNATSVSVDLQTIRWSDPEKRLRYTYLTPRIAQINLIKFDQGIKPEEFAFHLRGGQVTRMSSRASGHTRAAPGSRKSRAATASASASISAPARPTISVPRKRELAPTGGSDQVPRVVGGRTPPTTSFARRREFGLRGLDR
jgi:hypothetical protein